MNYIFDPEWFKSKQKFLLWFLNTPLIRVWFRRVMRIRKYDCKEKITQITPNSISWGDKLIWNTKKGKLEIERTTDFRTHNKYSKRLYHAFKYVWYLFHAWDLGFANIFAPQLNLGFDTLTVYPDAGSGGTTVDGRVYRYNSSSESWASMVSGAGTSVESVSETTGVIVGYNTGSSSGFLWNYRAIFTLDTSALTSDATISSSVFSVYGTAKEDALNSTPTANVYAVSPAANNNLQASDYNVANWGSTAYSDTSVTYAGYNTSGYNSWTFNSTGNGAVSKTGITKLGIRNNYDISGSAPGTWGSNIRTLLNNYFADQTGTTTDPKLVITYSTSTAYTQTCSETLSLTDTTSRSTRFNKSISETLSMTEAVSKSQGMYKSLTETLSLSDAISSAIQRGLLLLETLHITDTIQRTTRFAKTLTESISLTDTLASAKQFFVTLSETIGLTDAISKSVKFAKTLSETLHFTDVIKVTGWFWNYLFKRTSSYDYKTKSKNTWTYKDK